MSEKHTQEETLSANRPYAGGEMASGVAPQTYIHNVQPNLRVIANPGPLGLFSFASTTFVLSLYNVQARGVTVPNMVIGLALGVGGLCQLLAGMWEFATGNTFGATAFSSYGGFWLSYAAILIPGTGIGATFSDPDIKPEEPSAIGIYLSCWVIVTFIFFIASLRINIGLIALFGFLDLTFILLMAGEFSGNETIPKVAGGFGILTAAIAYYCGTCQLLSAGTSLFTLPIGDLKKRD